MRSPTPASNRPRTVEDALVDELRRVRFGLVEVILPYTIDPTPFIEALVAGRPGRRVGVGVLGLESWGEVQRLAGDHPVDEMTDDAVILVLDPTILALSDANGGWDSDRLEPVPGPLAWLQHDPWKAEATAVAAMLSAVFKAQREACERDEGLVVVFTVDHRPPAGRGAFRESFRFTDVALRSLAGDAGRYYAHQRYRVGYDRRGPVLVVIKDEAEAARGRFIWSRSGYVVQPTAGRRRARGAATGLPTPDDDGSFGVDLAEDPGDVGDLLDAVINAP